MYYAERQKNLVTSEELHKTPHIKNNHSSPYEAHLEKKTVLFIFKTEKIAVNLQQVSFKNHRNFTERAPRKAAFSEHSIATHSISMVGYITALLDIVCDVCPAQ